MRCSLVIAALLVTGCGKHRDRVVSAARDTVPITITTSFPGASPAEIAETVTTPLELQLGQAAKLEALHSRSTEGRSVIVAEFASGTDVDTASQDVQKAINAATNLLPHDLPAPPTYARTARGGAVLRLTLASKTLPLVQVADVASSIVAQKLSEVSGVGEVSVCGPKEQTEITVDPQALAAMGKTIDDVRTAIASAAVGSPTDGNPNGPVDEFRQISIVRDTARVETTERGDCVAIATGNLRVVAVTVTPQVGADPLEVRERLESLIPAIAPRLPADIHVDVWPRTRPLGYELELEPGMTLARRIDQLERALTELHLATRSLVQFGDEDRGPDVADLRIVPQEGHDKDVDDDVVPTFARFHFTVLGHHDHVVGFAGADVAELRKQRDVLVAALAKAKDLHVVAQLGGEGQARPVVTLDRDRAATLGLPLQEVATTLRVLAPGGMRVATTFTQLDAYPVMLAVDGHLPGVLDQVMVKSSSGSLVPLSAVARVSEAQVPDVIFHEGQFPWIGVRIAGSLDVLQDALAKLPMPASIHRDVREPD